MAKRILLLAPASNKSRTTLSVQEKYRQLLPHYAPDAQITVASLHDLDFCFGPESFVRHWQQGYDIADFDLVVFVSVAKETERAIAAAHYLASKDIAFTDQYLAQPGKGKLAGSAVRYRYKLPAPKTLYSSNDLKTLVADNLTMPFILKADEGRKGQNNYLIRDQTQFDEALADTKAQGINMIAQEYIPSTGDYRILVMGGQVALVIKRNIVGDTHLSNTSQGGHAEIIDAHELNQAILDDALQAAKREQLQVAGVDIIISETTGQHYILEVNRAPQLASGAFVEEKLARYAEFLLRF